MPPPYQGIPPPPTTTDTARYNDNLAPFPSLLVFISLFSRCKGGGWKAGVELNHTTKNLGFFPYTAPSPILHTQKEMNLWVKSVRGWTGPVLARYFLHGQGQH
jgi:hypothetical protein